MPDHQVNIFPGFTRQTIRFLTDLKTNNHKEWFQANKETYENHVMVPARSFVTNMGIQLQKSISDQIVAHPTVNKSIFRIYRDTRFSLNKLPYKTHLGIYFWEGPGKKLENSGFYFHLDPPNLMLGAGIYMFPKHLMVPFRKAAVDEQWGEELTSIIQTMTASGHYSVGGKYYKRIPPGSDPDHPNTQLLLHNGLWASFESFIPDELFTEALIPYCLKKFREIAPLHSWLVQMSRRSAKQI